MITRLHRSAHHNPPRRLVLAVTALWAVAALGNTRAEAQSATPEYDTLAGKVIVVTPPGTTSAADLAVRLAESQLLGDGTLRRLRDRVYVIDVNNINANDLAANNGVQDVYQAFQRGDAVVAANRLQVIFAVPPSAADIADFAEDYDLITTKQFTAFEGYAVFAPRDSGTNLAERMMQIRLDPRVSYVNLDTLDYDAYVKQAASPDDTFFGNQWHHETLGSEAAWATTLGENVRIGMLDDGCFFNHEDLVSNYIGVSDGGSFSSDAAPLSPFNNHGTQVMGLMAAAANDIGVRGMAPRARFTASSTLFLSASDKVESYQFAMDQKVDVHNNSWGARFLDLSIINAVRDAADNGRDGKGMVIAWSTGNDGIELIGDGKDAETDAELTQLDDYSALAEVIAVGATNENDIKTQYSNYGKALDIVGPSGPDFGANLRGMATTNVPDFGLYTFSFDGTSASSPVVAGVAALVLSVNPELNREQVFNLLFHSAEPVSEADAGYDETTRFSTTYGYGRVNAELAVEAAVASLEGNQTWPGVPSDYEIEITEPDDDVVAEIKWRPPGPEVDGDIETDMTQVLILYRTSDAEGDLDWLPEDDPADDNNDGIPDAFEFGEIDVVDDGTEVEGNDGWFPIYFGNVIQDPDDDLLQMVPDLLVVDGDVDEAKRFAVFAVNSRNEVGFGRFVNVDADGNAEIDDRVEVGGGGGGQVAPPDAGRPINPEFEPPIIGFNEPPSVSATVDVRLGRAPLTVQFFGNAVTPEEINGRGWSFGDGNSSQQDTVAHTYSLPGVYNSVFFAENELGVSTKMFRIEVLDEGGSSLLPNALLTARISVDTPGPYLAPASVTLTASTTGVADDDDVASIRYDWEFGDGKFGTGKTIQTIYENSGFYSALVRVTVTRTDGSVEQVDAQRLIEVVGVDPAGVAGQPTTTDGLGSNGTATGNGSCGTMGPAMMVLAMLSLAGYRCRRRRR